MQSEEQIKQQGEQDFWRKVLTQTEHALATGALQPIETQSQRLTQAGIDFIVRISSSLRRKAQADSSPRPNPFLPYEPDLFVADLSPTHLCLLNKFNVTPHHLLIITRDFQPQELLLETSDFEALWSCMATVQQQGIDSLGFYNSGKQAGASQPHRHLQLLPLAPDQPLPVQVPMQVPIQMALAAATAQSPSLPFSHIIGRLSDGTTAAAAHSLYLQLLDQLGLQVAEPPPYNLLITRQWMLIVPRRQEQFETIPVNSLGFAGSLFVHSPDQLEQLKQIGPLSLLAKVAFQVD